MDKPQKGFRQYSRKEFTAVSINLDLIFDGELLGLYKIFKED